MKNLKRIFPLILLALPTIALADGLSNPLNIKCDTSESCLTSVIVNISKGLIGLAAVGATFMFIYGGVIMITSGGNEKRVTQGKDILKWTALGLVLMLSAGVLLRGVYQVLGQNGFTDISQSIGLGNASVSQTAVTFLNAVLGLLGIVGVTMVIWGGYQWLTAAGNEQRVERAKQILTAAVVGLVIILLSWAIVHFVLFTGANLTKGST